MTTPGQPAPDGAYIIGGSGNAYGQEMTDASAAHLMLGGFTSIASIANPLDAVGAAMGMFAQSLLKLPLDVLKLFEPLIPGDLGDVFGTVGGAVDAIMGFFQQIGPLLTSTFNSFITTSYNILSSGFQQILDIVNGLVVVPISSAVSGFKDWFTGLMGSTIPDLGTAVTGAVNQVSDLIHDLLTAPASVLGTLPQTLVSGLTGALSDVNGFVQGVVNAIIQAISGIPFVGGSIAAALTALTGAVQVQRVDQQNATITVANVVASNATWECRDPVADVSYIEALNGVSLVIGATDGASAGTAHTHALSGSTLTARSGPGSQSIPSGSARATVIGVRKPIVYDTVAVMLQKNGGSPSPVIVSVHRMDKTGNVQAPLFTSSNISSLFSGTTFVPLTLSTRIVAVPGERYFVKVLNGSGTAQALGWTGLYQDTSTADFGFIFSGTKATQTSYTVSDLSGTADSLCWAMLSQRNPVASPKTYTDDFNNRTVLGPKWFPMSNTGSNQLSVTSNRLAFQSTTNGDQVVFYTDPIDSDSMLVEANCYNRVTTPRLGVMACCNRELTQTVYLGVNSSSAILYTGAWNSLTAQKTITVTTGDSKWGIRNEPSTSKFYIMRDGTDIDSWTDTGGVVQLGYDYRFGGARITRASGVNAGTMDNFALRDV